jgi:hypothetical protein
VYLSFSLVRPFGGTFDLRLVCTFEKYHFPTISASTLIGSLLQWITLWRELVPRLCAFFSHITECVHLNPGSGSYVRDKKALKATAGFELNSPDFKLRPTSFGEDFKSQAMPCRISTVIDHILGGYGEAADTEKPHNQLSQSNP